MFQNLRADQFTTLTAGVINTVSFTGSGTDNLTVSGNPNFATTRSYRVTIDSASETFSWSNDGGSTTEQTGIPTSRAVGVPYSLINAEGENEGLTIRFGGSTGHTNADRWDWTTTGTVVTDAVTAVGGVQATKGAEGLILLVEYSKGTETGLQLYLRDTREFGGSILYRASNDLEIGDGGLRYQADYREFLATANAELRFNLNGLEFFRLYQVSAGGTESGTFVALAKLYGITR